MLFKKNVLVWFGAFRKSVCVCVFNLFTLNTCLLLPLYSLISMQLLLPIGFSLQPLSASILHCFVPLAVISPLCVVCAFLPVRYQQPNSLPGGQHHQWPPNRLCPCAKQGCQGKCHRQGGWHSSMRRGQWQTPIRPPPGLPPHTRGFLPGAGSDILIERTRSVAVTSHRWDVAADLGAGCHPVTFTQRGER